jgi:SSS family solute:Na+ symporter
MFYTRTVVFMKMMMPNGEIVQDNAYPTMLNLLGPGLKGLAFAALTAAVVASLAGKANSIATIFTLDIYKKKINPEASEKNMVWVGKVAVSLHDIRCGDRTVHGY